MGAVRRRVPGRWRRRIPAGSLEIRRRRSPGMSDATLAEICVVACAEAWRGDGAVLASPMGVIPTLGARLAQLTFQPELLLTDGEATLLSPHRASRVPQDSL